MKPAPAMSPRKTRSASRTSGYGGWQPSSDVVALPTQVRRSVITADAPPKVTPFLDQPFMKDVTGSSLVFFSRRQPDYPPPQAGEGLHALDGRRRGRPPADQ